MLKYLLNLCLFFILTGAISYGIGELQKEHYTASDTPDAKFRVNGQRLQDIKGDTQLQTEPTPIENCIDSCLKILENGNYLYINEGALQTTYSEYKIKDNIVKPISFKEDNFGNFLIGIVLVFLVIGIFKYSVKLYQIRHDKNAIILYHKKLLKRLFIMLCLVLVVYGIGVAPNIK